MCSAVSQYTLSSGAVLTSFGERTKDHGEASIVRLSTIHKNQYKRAHIDPLMVFVQIVLRINVLFVILQAFFQFHRNCHSD